MKELSQFRHPVRLLLVLGATLFITEFLMHMVIGSTLRPIFLFLFDAALLTLILFPILLRLKKVEEQLRLIFDSSPNALLAILDKAGTIVQVNHKTEEMFGYRSDELVGQRVEVLVPERFRPDHLKLRTKYIDAPSARPMGAGRELFALHKGGQEIPVEIALSPIKTKHEILVLVTVTDITERKKIECQRDDALKAREELVAIVSHEIRNPLSLIATGVALIRRLLPKGYESWEKIDGQLELITRAALRMTKITSDLLDVTRIDGNLFKVESKMTDVMRLVNDVVTQSQSSAEKKSIHLTSHVSPLANTVACDKDRIMQVLTNLVDNAIKFTGVGGLFLLPRSPTRTASVFKSRIPGPAFHPTRYRMFSNDSGRRNIKNIWVRAWDSIYPRE